MNWEFAQPWALLALITIPALGVWMFTPKFRRRQEGTFLFTGIDLLSVQKRSWRSRLARLPDVLFLAALTLVIFALARPQSVEPQEIEVEGIDIYLALDMSGSMRAIDMNRNELNSIMRAGKAPKNRFESAVETLKEFTLSRDYDRIGMVVFARDAFLQFPLTLDRRTIIMMLDRLTLGDIHEGGTAIGNAIGRGVAGLKDSEARTKILILITDGERRGGNISPNQAAGIAKDLGIRIYPILVGKEGLALVPVQGGDPFSGRTTYRETEFPVNPQLLKDIAQKTQGKYYRATDADGLRSDLHSILDEFERSRIRDTSNVEPEELYRDLVHAAVLLLLAQFLLQFVMLRRFP